MGSSQWDVQGARGSFSGVDCRATWSPGIDIVAAPRCVPGRGARSRGIVDSVPAGPGRTVGRVVVRVVGAKGTSRGPGWVNYAPPARRRRAVVVPRVHGSRLRGGVGQGGDVGKRVALGARTRVRIVLRSGMSIRRGGQTPVQMVRRLGLVRNGRRPACKDSCHGEQKGQRQSLRLGNGGGRRSSQVLFRTLVGGKR